MLYNYITMHGVKTINTYTIGCRK